MKYDPQRVSDEQIEELRHHFTDEQINEIAVTVMAFALSHHRAASIGEDVVDDDGRSLADPDGPFGRDGFTMLHHGTNADRR